jgi:hypothetical protein
MLESFWLPYFFNAKCDYILLWMIATSATSQNWESSPSACI